LKYLSQGKVRISGNFLYTNFSHKRERSAEIV
jgi:hypothetical protein